MMIHLLKGSFFLFDTLFRALFYNRHLPEVAAVHKNLPYGPHPSQMLDVIQPSGDGSHPVGVYVHGGGFCVGDKESYNRICRTFADKGTLIFNINYRLSPRFQFPAQMQDIASAIQWITEHAESYGGDPSRLFLMGDSAGAHLASWYAAAVNKPELFEVTGIAEWVPAETIKGLLLFYGSYDIETAMQRNFPMVKTLMSAFMGKVPLAAEKIQSASPARHISSRYPATFLCAGEPDPLFLESKAMEKILKEKGVRCKSLFFSRSDFPEAEHGFLNFYKRPCSQMAMKKALRFIEQLTQR
jgi:acetyl esterase/lipase